MWETKVIWSDETLVEREIVNKLCGLVCRYPDENLWRDCIKKDKYTYVMWEYFIGSIQGGLIPVYYNGTLSLR